MSACDRVSSAKKPRYIEFLLGKESESRDYWAVKTGTKELPTWQMLLSSKKILHKGLDIDLSEFYDEDGNYKHELVKGDKVSQELKDEIKKLHSYEVPAIIKINGEANSEYENWVTENTKS